jgi:tRNA(Glu) U13 pseudouridine synthase TruD
MVSGDAEQLEKSVINQYEVLRDGLVAARVKAMRRACRVIPDGMRAERMDDHFVVSFELPAGSYASVVMAEIFSDLIEP